jgi:CRP/FNR family transcriptional activator FtrB
MLALQSECARLTHAREADELSKHPLWAGCRQSTIELMLQRSIRQKFSSRAIIALEGTPADFLHVVIGGSVELFSRYRKQETEFAVIEPPHAFIVAAVITNRFHLTSARVLQPSEILMIPADCVREAFDRDEMFSRKIAIELAHSYRVVTSELKRQTLLSAVERLANWLLDRDEETGGRHQFAIPFDKRTLATRLGMVPEVLSRGLATLGKYDVHVRRAYVEIRDPAALDRLAKPKPPFYDPKE